MGSTDLNSTLNFSFVLPSPYQKIKSVLPRLLQSIGSRGPGRTDLRFSQGLGTRDFRGALNLKLVLPSSSHSLKSLHPKVSKSTGGRGLGRTHLRL